MTKQAQNIIVVTLLLAFTVALYFNSLWGIFLFDDGHSIQDNLFVKDARYIPYFFKGYYTSAPHVPKGMLRPLLLLTFSFNYYFSGLSPLGYHIINMVLHFLNGVLFFYFLSILRTVSPRVGPYDITKQQAFPFGLCIITSLIFLAHPLNTEAVCYISSRSDLLVCAFILSGLICYHQHRRIAAFFLYAIGLLAKETALVFPLLAVTLDLIYRPEELRDKQLFRLQALPFYLMIGLLTILYLVCRSIVLNFGAAYTFTAPFTSNVRGMEANIAIQAIVSFFYLRMFLFPHPLAIHHNFPEFRTLFSPLPVLAVSGIAALLILAWAVRSKRPLVSLGIFWYFICLLPKFYGTLHIVAAEHHFYLAGFGVYLLLAELLSGGYARFKRKFFILAAGVLAIFFVLVISRNSDYRSEYAFWRSAVLSDPTSAVAHHNLGLAYVEKQDYKAAEEEFKKSLELSPVHSSHGKKTARENLANIYRLQKNYDQAIAYINENIKLGIGDFSSYQNLGVIYSDMGDFEKAEQSWKKGLSLYPYASGIHASLGLLSLRKNNLADAKRYFQAAIASDPDIALGYFGLGEAAEKESDAGLAIGFYEKTLVKDPDYILAHYQLSKLYFSKKEYLKAARALTNVIRLNPYLPEAHYNLAVLYLAIDPPLIEEARYHLKQALFLGFPVDAKLLDILAVPPQ